MWGPVLQSVDLCYNVWTYVAMCGPVLQCGDLHYNVWTCVTMCGPTLQCVLTVDYTVDGLNRKAE